MIWSTAEAWDSTWHPPKYLESLKNAEADREGAHFPFTISSPQSFLLIQLSSLSYNTDYTVSSSVGRAVQRESCPISY
jgi:hypothetical protein